MGIVFMKSRLKIPSHPRKFRLTLGNSVSPSEIPSHPRRFRLTLGDSVSPSEIPSHPCSFSNIPKLPNFTKYNISRINILSFYISSFPLLCVFYIHIIITFEVTFCCIWIWWGPRFAAILHHVADIFLDKQQILGLNLVSLREFKVDKSADVFHERLLSWTFKFELSK